MVFAVFIAVLGLYQQHTINSFMSVESHGSSVFQYGNTLYLFYCKTVDRSLYTINKNQNVFLASGLDTTDIKRCATTFLAFETSVLEGIQAK